MGGACSTRGKVRRTVKGNVMDICLFVYFCGRLILNCTNPFITDICRNCTQIPGVYVTENIVRVHYKE